MANRAIHPANHALDVAAAAVPAVAAGWAAAKLAPLAQYPMTGTIAVASLPIFLLAYSAMRRSGADEQGFSVPTFVPPPLEEDELLLDTRAVSGEVLLLEIPFRGPAEDELLLDQRWSAESQALLCDRPSMDRQVDELAELLLDDPLRSIPSDSRVVRLFAPQALPTAGQLADRIERHLGHAPAETPSEDGYDALREALEELRRSLRRA